MQPPTEPLIDLVSTVGWILGLSVALWFGFVRHEPLRHSLPFVIFAVAFTLFGIDGGVLDPLPMGQTRLLALLCILIAEALTAYLIRYPLATSRAY